MTVHEQLVAARNLLARSRWLQGKVYERDAEGVEGYCAEWAVRASSAPSVRRAAALARLTEAVGDSVPVFNDAPGRTKDEVLAAFDKAIAATAPPPPDPGVPVEAPKARVAS